MISQAQLAPQLHLLLLLLLGGKCNLYALQHTRIMDFEGQAMREDIKILGHVVCPFVCKYVCVYDALISKISRCPL